MIVVVGSMNRDAVLEVERHPIPGETVTAFAFHVADGGKGANQAVAAARLGGSVTFLGAVGDDLQGEAMCHSLASEGVDVSSLQVVEGVRSGSATVTVDASGENSIIVYPGANHSLALSEDALLAIAGASVVLLQLEVEMSIVLEAAQAATGIVILNAAPAVSLPSNLLDTVDVLIVNEHERATALEHVEPGTLTVITTRGAKGALVEMSGSTHRVPSPDTDVVDTTGAGDAFCGAFAEAVARGEDILTATKWATIAGSIATRAVGARAAMPTRQDIDHEARES